MSSGGKRGWPHDLAFFFSWKKQKSSMTMEISIKVFSLILLCIRG